MKISGKIMGAIALLLVLAALGSGYVLRKLDERGGAAKMDSTAKNANGARESGVQPVSGLKIEDLTVGTVAEAVAGKTVTVNYLGTLMDGTKFDSSYDRNQPFEFTLGSGQVIAGWDQGFAGMKVGGKRKLIISPEMGYGGRAAGTIPPNSTLVFEVELLAVGD